MLQGKRCEDCNRVIDEPRSRHKQTRFCLECAKRRKRQNSEDPWPAEKRRLYMRDYMRRYRHPETTAMKGVA